MTTLTDEELMELIHEGYEIGKEFVKNVSEIKTPGNLFGFVMMGAESSSEDSRMAFCSLNTSITPNQILVCAEHYLAEMLFLLKVPEEEIKPVCKELMSRVMKTYKIFKNKKVIHNKSN